MRGKKIGSHIRQIGFEASSWSIEYYLFLSIVSYCQNTSFKMNKILFIHPLDDFTGSTRVLANVIETQYADRRVTVITLRNDGFLSLLPNVNIIPIKYPSFRGKRIPVFSGLIWRIYAWYLTFLYGWNYDIFYINTIMPYYAAVVGRIYRKKIVYHVHEKFVTQSLYVKVAEYVFNHVKSKRIFVSEYLKQQYPDKSNCESIVEYNRLPHSFLSKVQVVPITERKRDTLLMITSLTKAKGIFTYIEVAKQLPEYTCRLLVSANLEEIMNYFHYDIPHNVEIIPKQSDIHPFLRTSDLLLNLTNPSLSIETFGMTILEAMAYGIPSIVPNVGGPTELIINGYNGYCVDVTNVNIVVNSIRRILNKKKYENCVRYSLERVKYFI